MREAGKGIDTPRGIEVRHLHRVPEGHGGRSSTSTPTNTDREDWCGWCESLSCEIDVISRDHDNVHFSRTRTHRSSYQEALTGTLSREVDNANCSATATSGAAHGVRGGFVLQME